MRLLISLLFILYFIDGTSQNTIVGKVIDGHSKEGIDYASVSIINPQNGNVEYGTITESGGEFKLETHLMTVKIEVNFIGFQKLELNDIKLDNTTLDLGDLYMNEDAKVLEEVVVTAQKSTTEFKLDKRVFNVGADLSTTGASALEVLNNVPSVNVNIEGQVSLRGATGVQILINGKPSVLADDSSNALGTITADMIDRVEVITNPSAKYEAEGTSGIINIVLKKNEKRGMNGSVSVNTGVPHNHSVGLSINNRTNKFNLFSQIGVGYRELPTDINNDNFDKLSNIEISSVGEEFRNEQFYNIVLGTDYYFNEKNIITLSGSFAYEVEDQPSLTLFNEKTAEVVTSTWEREEVTSATNPKLQYELQYKREFDDNEDHTLLFSAIGNYFGKDQNSVFTNQSILNTIPFGNQQTETSFNEGKFTFNFDYTKPFSDHITIESGFQYLLNDVNNDFEVRNEDETGVFVSDPNFTNVFEYQQNVLGVYTTGAYEYGVWGFKLGLRAENTDLQTLLVDTNESNEQNFWNLFPSLHSSYKLSDRVSFQMGYSRRIFRPRLWDLNPFFNIRNNFNIRAGNPDLLPEFTDSYEVGAIFIFDQVTFNTNIYHRYTTDKVERIAIFENGVTTRIPQNIGTNKATGVEVNFKYTPSKKIVFNGDANYNVFDRNGSFNDQNFNFSADVWSSKLTTKYKVSKALDTEVTVRHESQEQTIQGTRRANTFADLGLRYKILNGKGVFNFSVRDLFASRIRQTTIDNDDFFTFSRSQRGRFITLGFSYGFGKGEAMQYSGGRRR